RPNANPVVPRSDIPSVPAQGPDFRSSAEDFRDLAGFSRDQAPTPSPGGRSEEPPTAASAPPVLVIADNVDAAESLRDVLELDGYEAAIAHDGPRGVEAARSFQPHAVLCDIGLPGGMDGYAVARALRADAKLGSVFLVALTGYDGPE